MLKIITRLFSMRPRSRRCSSSRVSGDGRAVLGDNRERCSGGDMGTPGKLPRGRLGTMPAFPRLGEFGAHSGDWGDGGDLEDGGGSRAALSVPAVPGLLRNRDARRNKHCG